MAIPADICCKSLGVEPSIVCGSISRSPLPIHPVFRAVLVGRGGDESPSIDARLADQSTGLAVCVDVLVSGWMPIKAKEYAVPGSANCRQAPVVSCGRGVSDWLASGVSVTARGLVR